MGLKQLHKGTEDQRRLKIIQVSRSRDERYLPQLLARLESDETYENRRQIVRALGNIADPGTETVLLKLLGKEEGLMLGDIAAALAKFGSKQAVGDISRLQHHEMPWVRQQAGRALRKLSAKS